LHCNKNAKKNNWGQININLNNLKKQINWGQIKFDRKTAFLGQIMAVY